MLVRLKRLSANLYILSTSLAVIVLIIVMGIGANQSSSPRKVVEQPLSRKHQQHTKPTVPKPPYLFPAGGRQLVPQYRFVALYGTPSTPVLGVLGAQDMSASVVRVKALSAEYQKLTADIVYPTFEIIATVASDSPTENGDYSRELDAVSLLPWVIEARNQGVYVVLDLQPGRNDFLTQAKQYQQLLEQPNVGLAFDPEWRLTPEEKPLVDIGSVSADEVNRTTQWLSDLVSSHKLPQKLIVLHQFRMDMYPDRERIATTDKNLTFVLQMDGQGSQHVKLDTWRTVTRELSAEIEPGWKNFYVKDTPVLDPAGTMQLTPTPRYISYQ